MALRVLNYDPPGDGLSWIVSEHKKHRGDGIMLRVAWLLLLFHPLTSQAQTITVGDAIPGQEVDAARQTIEKAQPKIITLSVGQFEVIEPAKGVTVSLLWLMTNDASVQKIEIPAGQAFSTYGIRRGEKVAKHHVFQAKPFSWSVLIGIVNGKNTITLVRSADKPELSPLVVDKIDLTIGNAPPKPDDPPAEVDDETTKGIRSALAKDKASGVADPKWLLALSGIYEAASKDPLDNINTAGDLDNLIHAARVAAGIPKPEKMLPEVRQYIKRQLQANLGTEATTPISVDAKRLAKVLMGKISDSLEKLAK